MKEKWELAFFFWFLKITFFIVVALNSYFVTFNNLIFKLFLMVSAHWSQSDKKCSILTEIAKIGDNPYLHSLKWAKMGSKRNRNETKIVLNWPKIEDKSIMKSKLIFWPKWKWFVNPILLCAMKNFDFLVMNNVWIFLSY